jgi:type IV pilus assembly protein PilV
MEPIVNLDSRSGFTLIEFCVAVLIMMVGLLGLLQAVNMTSVHNLGSLLRNEAISVADEQMVLTKASVFDSATFTALAATSGQVNRKARGGFNNYSVNRTVAATSTNSREVAVRVSWRFKGNRFNHIISTLVLNPNQL